MQLTCNMQEAEQHTTPPLDEHKPYMATTIHTTCLHWILRQINNTVPPCSTLCSESCCCMWCVYDTTQDVHDTVLQQARCWLHLQHDPI